MYYELRIAIGQNYGITGWPTFPDEVSFQSADAIAVPINEPIKFEVDNTSENPPSDFVGFYIPVFSDALAAAFLDAGADNIQTYQAQLVNPKSGEMWEGYKAVNIVGKIACADLVHSEYSVITSGLYSFTRLAVDTAKTHDALLFRLEEDPSIVLVHMKIAQAMYVDNNPRFQGLAFKPVDYV